MTSWPANKLSTNHRGVSAIDPQRVAKRSERQFQLQVDTAPNLRESVLLALISYFATRIGTDLYQLICALYLMASG
jgi:hypothetical protein